jgi:hypothetical protein
MRNVALLLIGCLLCSCATISHGSNEVIRVESSPSGANATIRCAGNISTSGTTPARLTIPRKADGCNVNVELNGMKTQNVQLERGFTGTYWLNFVPTLGLPIYVISQGIFWSTGSAPAGWLVIGLAGAAGFVVDRVTGAMYDHDPHVINVTLQPQQ